MSSINRINLSVYKNNKQEFLNEKNHFVSVTMSNFQSGYLKSSEYPINIMASRIECALDNINNLYNSIENWMQNYQNDLEGIESALSSGNVGSIIESEIRNKISSLVDLQDYNPSFATFSFQGKNVFEFAASQMGEVELQNTAYVLSAFDKIKQAAKNIFGYVKDEVPQTQAEVSQGLITATDEAAKFIKKDILPPLYQMNKNIKTVQKRVGATISNGAISIFEGIGKFGEAIFDTATILGTGILSLFTGAADLITGESYTETMWDTTKAFVSNQYMNGWFDSFYDNTELGQYIKDNSYAFDTVREVGNGVGYVAGATLLTILTFGVGGAVVGGTAAAGGAATVGITAGQTAAVAGLAGFGKGTESAWIDGASLGEGLGAGALYGVWDAIQYFVGSKIATSTAFLPKNSAVGASFSQKLSNSLSKILMDSVDGGVEGFVQPFITTIYKDGYIDDLGNYREFRNDNSLHFWDKYCELFDDNGGWAALATNAAVAGGSSLLGEIFDIKKFFKDKKVMDIVDQADIDNSSNFSSVLDEKITNNINPNPIRNLDDQIALANYYTSQGNFFTITMDSLDDIPDDFFNKIKNSQNIMIQVSDGTVYNISQVTEMLGNELNLKNQILKCIGGVDDSISKARILYEELNKKLHYSMDYAIGNQDVKDSILNQTLSFENLKGNNVVCKGWSELYKELLIEAGFDEADVIIQKSGPHRWIEVNLQNGNILLADATELMVNAVDHPIDLVAAKAGYATSGFLVLNDSFSGKRPSQLYGDINNNDIIRSNAEMLKSLDNYLGYATPDGYAFDQIEKAKSLFGNSKLLNSLFGIDSFSKKMQQIFDYDIPNDMDGYEAWAFFRKISKNILGDDNSKMINLFLYNQTSTKVEPINVISYIDDSGVSHYQIFSESLGKIFFNSDAEFVEFKKTLNLIERK